MKYILYRSLCDHIVVILTISYIIMVVTQSQKMLLIKWWNLFSYCLYWL